MSNETTLQDWMVAFAEYIDWEEVEERLQVQDKTDNVLEVKLLLSNLPEIAQRELLLWAEGYTIDDIGEIVGFANSTIHRHLKQSFTTLKALVGGENAKVENPTQI
jgi:DNA-directed RNA polymerase specialized sigma24 family protein